MAKNESQHTQSGKKEIFHGLILIKVLNINK
jgi:hypothetical protein